MELTLTELEQLLTECARRGAELAKRKNKDEISQREAFRIFGEARVRSLVNEGKVKRIQIGSNTSKCTYSYTAISKYLK